MDENIQINEWITPNKLRQNFKPQREPLIDKDISNIVGRDIRVNDPRLIKLVCEWKRNKDPEQSDNFLQDEKKRKQLREVLK